MMDERTKDLLSKVKQARDFPNNTCGASRHVQIIGEALVKGRHYPMLAEEPDHCGWSMLATVKALYEARTEIESLRADADRFRWLLDHDELFNHVNSNDFIAAIDAARKEGSES